MPPQTDPAAAPAYVLNALRSAEAEPYSVDGEPDQYRLPDQPAAKPWRQCVEDLGRGYNVARQEALALRVERDALKSQVAQLVAATPKSGFLSSEFMLSILTALPMVAGAVFVILQDNAEALFPPPWGKVIAAIAAVLAVQITRGYTNKRTELKEQAVEAKKQIADEKKAA